MPQTVGHVPVVAIVEVVVAEKVVTAEAVDTTEDATVDLADHPREMARKRATKKTIRIDLRLTKSQDDHFTNAVEAEVDAEVVIADAAVTVDDLEVMAQVMTTSTHLKMKVVKVSTTIKVVIAEEMEKVADVHDASEGDRGGLHKAREMKAIGNTAMTIVNIVGMIVVKAMIVPVVNKADGAANVDEDREEISAHANQRVMPKVATPKEHQRSNTTMMLHHPEMTLPHQCKPRNVLAFFFPNCVIIKSSILKYINQKFFKKFPSDSRRTYFPSIL